MDTIGQKEETWKEFWKDSTPESEIRMWDYFGLRQWVLKYLPRFGKVVEAGCGLGRYNFLLNRFGIQIEGLDFEKDTIDNLIVWAAQNGFNCEFRVGDVTSLPYADNSLSGYLSFGVVEHFIEGPQKPLAEAFRVLRPGGIAIITTPAPSWSIIFRKARSSIRKFIKILLRKSIHKIPFLQYEYSPQTLRNYVEASGFKTTRFSSADILFTFCEIGNYTNKFIKSGTLGYWLSNKLEHKTPFLLGAQSVTISVKVANIMHCFLCGGLTAEKKSLDKYDVPICDVCSTTELQSYYIKNSPVSFGQKYLIDPPFLKPTEKTCDFCTSIYKSDVLFEDYGFTKNVCPDCLCKTKINIPLSNNCIKPVWRKRS